MDTVPNPYYRPDPMLREVDPVTYYKTVERWNKMWEECIKYRERKE